MKESYKHKHKLNWYQLDTSAKIYPAIESVRNPALFRISMRLTEPVDGDVLLLALNDIKKRFPYYNVRMVKGVFWHYLEENPQELTVWPDTPTPCERILPSFNNGYLYKIKYFDNNIALEIFHVLTDGHGAVEFLKCLVQRYLILKGKLNKKLPGVIDWEETPGEEEHKDAFLTVADHHPRPQIDKERSLFGSNRSFHLVDPVLSMGTYRVITGVVSVDDIKMEAKKYEATVTQYLAALYLEALIYVQSKQIKKQRNHDFVSVQIPVNMRKLYPSKCMRNFSLFVIPAINPRKITKFEDIIPLVKQQMAEYLKEDHLLSMVHENCTLAKNKMLAHVPVGIKNLVIRYIHNTQGASQFSGTMSNLGVINLAPEMEALVENVQFILGPSPYEKCSCGITGYQGNLYISFGRGIKDPKIERHIFRRLVKSGVHVKIKSSH